MEPFLFSVRKLVQIKLSFYKDVSFPNHTERNLSNLPILFSTSLEETSPSIWHNKTTYAERNTTVAALRLLVQALHLETTAIKETITGHLVKQKAAGPRIGGRRLWSDVLADFSQWHEDYQTSLQRSSFFLCHLQAPSIPWVLLSSSLCCLERPSLGNATLLGTPSKGYVPSIIGTTLLPWDRWDERG